MKRIEVEKKGIPLFFHIIKKYFFILIYLNIVFVLTCIPIVTIGPACKAISKVTMDMIRDKDLFPIQLYFSEFRKDFFKTAIVGFLLTLIVSLMGYAIWVSVKDPELTKAFQFVVIISFVILLYILAGIMYLLRLLATIDLPMKQLWKNAFLLVFLSPKQMLVLFLFIVVPTILSLLFIQIGFSVFVIWHFSMSSLLSSFNAWKIIEKYVVVEK